MSSWLIPSLGLPVAMTTGRLVVQTLTGRVGSPDRCGDGGGRVCVDAHERLRSPGEPPPSATRFAARVDFLKNEVFEICSALALAESLLTRLGLPGEAAYLATVFDVVEGRLVEPVAYGVVGLGSFS